MKIKNPPIVKISLLFFLLIFFSKITIAQVDSTVKADTIKPEEPKKKSSGFIFYGGVTFNSMNTAPQYETNSNVGWALGVAYRRGKFFYWQVGARYNNAIYGVRDTAGSTLSESNSITVKDIDIPINVGLNLLSVTGKILGLRVYLGAVPAFLIGVNNNTNSSNLTKANTNSFNFYGQAGVGVDVLFLSIDAGYNAGFTDVFKNTESKPGQVFVNLGFRF